MLDAIHNAIDEYLGISPGEIQAMVLVWAVLVAAVVVHLFLRKLKRRGYATEPPASNAVLVRDMAAYEHAAKEMQQRNVNAPPHVQSARRHDLRNAYIGFACFCVLVVIPYALLVSSQRALDNAKPKRPPANQAR